MPDAPAAIATNWTPPTPSAPGAVSGSYTPGSPSAPGAISGSYAAGAPAAPGAVAGDYAPSEPSAPPSLAVDTRSLVASGTMAPDIAGMIFPPAGISGGRTAWSSDGSMTPPVSGVWWLIEFRNTDAWYVTRYTDGVPVPTAQWWNYDQAPTPVEVDGEWSINGTTGFPVFAFVPLPAPGVISGDFAAGTPSAPIAASASYAPGTPSAPVAASVSYAPGPPSAPGAVAGSFTAPPPSAPSAIGASYVPPTPSAPPVITT